MLPTCLVKVILQPGDTAKTIKEKAKAIFESYSEYTIFGYEWAEIVENEYVMIKIIYDP